MTTSFFPPYFPNPVSITPDPDKSHPMSLASFPDNVWNTIFLYILPSPSQLLQHGFQPRLSFGPLIADVLNLSVTCSQLRDICLQRLTLFVSLARASEIDSILACPRRMDQWSDLDAIRHRFIASFGANEFPHKVCAHVSHLEITNLTNGDLHAFPSLRNLVILAPPLDGIQAVVPPLDLTVLAVNMEILLATPNLLMAARNCSRLDVLCELEPGPANAAFAQLSNVLCSNTNLAELNVFVADAGLLQTAFLTLLAKLPQNTLHSLGLRVFNSKTRAQAEAQHDPHTAHTSETFLDFLRSASALKSLIIDYDILARLDFDPEFACASKSPVPGARFTMVDHSLSVPKLLFRPRLIVANLIRAMGATELAFVYGEVIDQSHLHAIGVVSNLLLYMALEATPYIGITKIALEKAWAMTDDSLVRMHCESLLDRYAAAPPDQKREIASSIKSVKRKNRFPFSSPRYRQPEIYEVFYSWDEDRHVPVILPSQITMQDRFWLVETSLRDLEHYSVRERELLRLWD